MAGRPREFDRDIALARARDLFWNRGYEGVSMADLVNALGLASARIYAAFGSKEDLFRQAIKLYESQEGGFAARALAEEPTVVRAIERMLREGVELYTRRGPRGCMVVSAATNCASENDRVQEWLAERRRARTATILKRMKKAVRSGELRKDADAQSLSDLCASVLHGISVQARDGVPRERLLAMIPVLIAILEAHPAE
jgi:AcrR family transcriptional regulator